MKKPLHVALLCALLLGSFLGGVWYNRGGGVKNAGPGERRVLYYVDPMNPSHTTDKPGTAPCGMALEPVYADEDPMHHGPGNAAASPGTVRITPQKQQMIGVQIGTVEQVSETHSVRTLGRVTPDENRVYRVLAGSDGWVWSVQGSTTGSLVQKDQLMATVYNYQFLARQQQYLYALNFGRQPRSTEQTQIPAPSAGRRDLGPINTEEGIQEMPGGFNPSGNVFYVRNQVELSKLELYKLGATDYQMEEIARTKKVSDYLEIRSPVTGIVLTRNISPQQRFDVNFELFRIADVSQVWVVADVYGREAHYVRPGTRARVTLPDRGKSFEASVSNVLPQFDGVTRTLKVRLDVDNPEFELLPDMFVDVEFAIGLPETLTVPVDAVLDSGLRKTVFVGLGNGYFEPREVKTGWRFDDRVQILEGLSAGEPIVVSGNFLIDSESRMKLAAGGFFGTPTKDPVCGMEVYPSKSKAAGLTLESGGKTHYFCSPECKEQFEKDPVQAVEKPVAGDKQLDAPGSQSQPAGSQPASLGSVKDPVCRMPVSESRAKAAGLEIEYGGKTYHFCSGQCKSHFIKAPERYADKPAPGVARQAAPPQGEHRHD
jgi:membrane fusion protein, copper/silver efflux system